MRPLPIAACILCGVLTLIAGGMPALRAVMLGVAETNLFVLHANARERPDDLGTPSDDPRRGASGPPVYSAILNAGALAACASFAARSAGPVRRCICGRSMGVARMLAAHLRMSPAPDCTIVASGVNPARGSVRTSGATAMLAALIHGGWNNVTAIAAACGRC